MSDSECVRCEGCGDVYDAVRDVMKACPACHGTAKMPTVEMIDYRASDECARQYAKDVAAGRASDGVKPKLQPIIPDAAQQAEEAASRIARLDMELESTRVKLVDVRSEAAAESSRMKWNAAAADEHAHGKVEGVSLALDKLIAALEKASRWRGEGE